MNRSAGPADAVAARRQHRGPLALSAVDELERFLGLRPRALSELIVRPARVGAVRAPRIPFDDERERREIAETFAALGAARQETLRDLSTHMAVVVGEDGAIESSTYRCLIQVTSGSLTELLNGTHLSTGVHDHSIRRPQPEHSLLMTSASS